MRLKHIYLGISLLAVSLLLSCKNEIDDIFNTSANKRIQETMDLCEATLLAAPNGWRINYTPKNGSELNFVMTFAPNDSVFMYVNTEKESWSRYRFYPGEGPVLSFDTYSVLHYYADPGVTDKDVSTDDDLKTGSGFGGDFEFIVCRITADEVIMRGRKNGDTVRFIAAGEGEINKIRLTRKLQERYRDTKAFFNVIRNSSSSADILMADNEPSQVTIITSDRDDVNNKIDVVYTKEGFQIKNAVEIGNNRVNEFTWNEILGTFVSDGSLMIRSTDTSSYSWGSTVDLLKGKVFDVVKVGPGTFCDWFDSFKSAFPEYERLQLYFDFSKNDGTFYTALSFVLTTNNAETWNDIVASESSSVRSDQLIHTRGTTSGPRAREILRSVIGKRIIDVFFDSAGYTVVERNGHLYITFAKDSSKWFEIKEATDINPNL